jgi:hypothetical protein
MNVSMNLISYELTREDGQVLVVHGGKDPDFSGELFLEFRLPDKDNSVRIAWKTDESPELRRLSHRRYTLQINGGERRQVISSYGLLYDARVPSEAPEREPLQFKELAPLWDYLEDLDIDDLEQRPMPTDPIGRIPDIIGGIPIGGIPDIIQLRGVEGWAGCVGDFTGGGAGIGAVIGGAVGLLPGAGKGGAIGGLIGGAFGLGWCTTKAVVK